MISDYSCFSLFTHHAPRIMSLPDLDRDGYLPPGLHAASLANDVIEGIDIQIRKIEDEIAEFFAKRKSERN